MSDQQTSVATREATQVAKRQVPVGDRGLVISDLDGMWRWATYVAASGLAPKGIEKAESIFVATQMGLEVGLTPMAALQNIAVINGRPTIWGDAQLGIVRATGELEEFSEWYEVKGQKINRNPSTYEDDVAAVCRVKRRGYEAQEHAFSVADAKRANLWGKQGPWSQYPSRMLKFRARGFLLRDQFGDALRGMMSKEEAEDLPAVVVDIPAAETPALPPPRRGFARAPKSPPPSDDQVPGAEVPPISSPRTVIPNDTTPENRVTANAENREPAESQGGGSDPAPAAGPELTPAQAKLAAIIESEGCTFDTLLFVCGDPKEGISAWRHLVKDCASIHDMRGEYVEYLVGKEKSLRAYLRTAKEAGK